MFVDFKFSTIKTEIEALLELHLKFIFSVFFPGFHLLKPGLIRHVLPVCIWDIKINHKFVVQYQRIKLMNLNG